MPCSEAEICNWPSNVYHSLSTVCLPPTAAYSPPPTAYRPSPTAYRWLPTVVVRDPARRHRAERAANGHKGGAAPLAGSPLPQPGPDIHMSRPPTRPSAGDAIRLITARNNNRGRTASALVYGQPTCVGSLHAPPPGPHTNTASLHGNAALASEQRRPGVACGRWIHVIAALSKGAHHRPSPGQQVATMRNTALSLHFLYATVFFTA